LIKSTREDSIFKGFLITFLHNAEDKVVSSYQSAL